MDNILTLVATTAGPLDPVLIDGVRDALFRLGAEVGRPNWLAPEKACDIAFSDLNTDQADSAARSILGKNAIDVVAQSAAGRRKQLLVADMESTLIRNEMLDELADFVGLRAEIAEVTARAMNGELDFEAALDARVALLARLPAATLVEAAARITEMPGARQLVTTMRKHGAYTAVVSGGFRYFTGKVRAQLGLDIDFANDLLIEDGKLTGKVARPILGRQAKYDTLVQLATERGLPLSATLSVGDGANDLDMILAAGLGIAFHAKPAVAARAKWRIEHGDLSTLLYVQGYRDTEFAS